MNNKIQTIIRGWLLPSLPISRITAFCIMMIYIFTIINLTAQVIILIDHYSVSTKTSEEKHDREKIVTAELENGTIVSTDWAFGEFKAGDVVWIVLDDKNIPGAFCDRRHVSYMYNDNEIPTHVITEWYGSYEANFLRGVVTEVGSEVGKNNFRVR